MSKTLSRLVFALWIASAPLAMIGCSEGEKPATPAATTTTETPAAPAEPTPAPATPATPAEPAPAK
jgi:hypothetical protein